MNDRETALAHVYYGTSQIEAQGQTLATGPWSTMLVDGALRDIRYRGTEVIRAIAWLVRDRDWGTCRPVIRDIEVDSHAERFRVSYTAECTNPDGHVLTCAVTIDCDADGALEFRARATAQTDFLAARCGFVVLHPVDGVAGAAARVGHGDGTVDASSFPALIDPWQPFKDIRTIEHSPASGLNVRCSFTGDVFEMEDQRNWSDASFKTYSRPLELPWPYTMDAGSTHEQSVRLQIEAAREQSPALPAVPHRECKVLIDLHGMNEPMPALGVAIAPDEIDAAFANLPLLAELAPQQLTLHFDPLAGHGQAELDRFAQFQRRAGIAAVLECALPGVGAPEEELQSIAVQIRQAGLALTGIVVSPSVHRQSNPPGSSSPPCPSLDDVYRACRRAFPDLRLGGGMLSYFTELNRKRPPLDRVDWVTHATCPIVHAADDRSVMETLEAIPHITRSCRALIGTQPYAIGPVSIGMRQNPYGSRVMPNPQGARVAMAGDDPRQRGLFGAAWLAGYAMALEGAALECLTLGALTGPRGLAGGLADSATDPARYPVFHVAAALARMAGRSRLQCRSERPRDVACFGARDAGGRLRLIIANLTPEKRTVRLDSGCGNRMGELGVATLDESSAAKARVGRVLADPISTGCDTFALDPFACVQIASGLTPFGRDFPPYEARRSSS
ncbi:D-apionate lactonase [Paraburkholderia gardini]|uniref:D-apionate lactonase n=1 Tax=Paraburkholderia gardini TaxID=2823469 RepID=A0ABN7QW80_9BURK|nr:hypothetical protein [Paraburkholderia gardini]CAG4918003.1 D-apionate lactonase [Paraburkholderia gardini]